MLRTWKNAEEEEDACARPRMCSLVRIALPHLCHCLFPCCRPPASESGSFQISWVSGCVSSAFWFVCVMGCRTGMPTKEPMSSTHHMGPQIPSFPLTVSSPLGCGGLLRQQRGVHYHGCWNMSDSQWTRKSLMKPAWAVTTSHEVTPYPHVAISGLMEGSLDAHRSRARSSGHVHRASPWLAVGRCRGRVLFSSELWVVS